MPQPTECAPCEADFARVLAEEFKAINDRRERLRYLAFPATPTVAIGRIGDIAPTLDEAAALTPVYDTAGLCLSGGGIRSASFALGVMQALDVGKTMHRFDYLSTVSGGGYIGASLTTTMKDGAEFVFGSHGAPVPIRSIFMRAGPRAAADEEDRSDAAAMRHLRNYSRYLVPNGLPDALADFAILLRGWVASALTIAPFVFLFAGLTLWAKPTIASLDHSAIAALVLDAMNGVCAGQFAGADCGRPTRLLGDFLGAQFVATKIWLSLAALFLAAWAIGRSLSEPEANRNDVGSRSAAWAKILLIIGALLFTIELQPFLLWWINLHPIGVARIVTFVGDHYGKVTAVLTALSAALGLFGRMLGETASKQDGEARRSPWRALFKKIFAQAVILVGAALLPLVVYATYLSLVRVGFVDRAPVQTPWSHLWSPWPWPWPTQLAGLTDFARLYLVAFLILGFFALLLRSNANSLHRLYRDRLAKAFLFDSQSLKRREVREGRTDPAPAPNLRFSALRNTLGPYPVVNAAINIQGSEFLNRRGRNADFFTFTPHRIGSEMTEYCDSAGLEALDPRIDVAAAMAISGAAVSSNMGRNSVRPLALTLTMLNLRLGYWLPNPRYVAPANDGERPRLRDWFKSAVYFASEAFGLLDERMSDIYLTDGGHIENLGLYQLLKRRCKLIVVVDGEQDGDYGFSSLVALQRFARIDLGVRIHLPWEEVRDSAKMVDAMMSNGALPANFDAKGKHVAVGEIDYGEGAGQKGLLVYVKASLSGDENDYILDYKRRYPAFPHETTGDQFFSEEQFEAYRALGFHAMNGFLKGTTPFAGEPARPPYDPLTDQERLTETRLCEVRAFLGA